MKSLKASLELHREWVIALCFSLLVAAGAVAYSTTLYHWVDGDEIVAYEAERALTDPSYPDKEVISQMGYATYIYPKIIFQLNKVFSIEQYKLILLFVFVFSATLAAYAGLRLLGVAFVPALLVSLVALMPRMGPVGEVFGVFTTMEVAGRFTVLGVFWLLGAWHARRLAENKRVWPVLLCVGALSYLHPATMVLFSGLLLLVTLAMRLRTTGIVNALSEVALGAIAFCVGAFFLVSEIVGRTLSIAKPDTLGFSGAEYAAAIRARMPWDYAPESFRWLRHVAIVSTFFVAAGGYLYHKRTEVLSDSRRKIYFEWSLWVMGFSLLVFAVVPALQLYLVAHFDAPLVLQQFSRISKFFYLGLFVAFALFIDWLWLQGKKQLVIVFVAIGLFSSSFAFEWAQFVIGYKNYQKEYIPVALQTAVLPNQYVAYAEVAQVLEALKLAPYEKVLSYDFNLRYFARVAPLVTFEEGTGNIFLGKDALVTWRHRLDEQRERFNKTTTLVDVKLYAKEKDVRYAIVSPDFGFVAEARPLGKVQFENALFAIVRLQ